VISQTIETARKWRLIHLLGLSTLRSRYARSKIGQAWLSISMFVFILAIGLIWSLIWGLPIDDYLPYIGVGHIVYSFVSQTINESSGVIVADSRLYVNDEMPFQLSIAAHVYRSILVFLHNLPTIILLVFWSDSAAVAIDHHFLFSFALVLVFTYFSCYLVAMICTRYRDITQIVSLVMQVSFLISPVMWKLEFIPSEYHVYLALNPFAAVLETIRNPIIGYDSLSYFHHSLQVWTAVVVLLSYVVYKKLNRHLIFWI